MRPKKINSHYAYLSNKWSVRHQQLQKKLWSKHKNALEWLRDSSKQMMVGSLASVVMLTHPLSGPMLAKALIHQTDKHILKSAPVNKKEELMLALALLLPNKVVPLTEEQEHNLAQVLTKNFNFPVMAELQGKRLNRNYGIIGAEQHLARYPGDTMETHFATPQEQRFYSSGMAPGLGGWGYFANSQQEKYYIAVPVFLSPGWHDDIVNYSKFFKFRKMLVINPENGKALVAVVGDAGPAEWTGKHLGGSPEVMDYLEREDGASRGPVLYFFIDDPENKIPLGPIAVQ